VSTYFSINRAIDKPIEFRGLKAQYILYAGGVVVGDILLFAILYICRIDSWACMLLSFVLGGGGVTLLYKFSKKYGPYGLAKKKAAKGVPPSIRSSTRGIFTQLNKQLCKNQWN